MAKHADSPGLLIVGEDYVLVRKELHARVAEIMPTVQYEGDYQSFRGKTPASDVISALLSYPFGSDCRLIVVEEVSDYTAEDAAKVVQALSNTPETTRWLFTAGKLAANNRLLKYAKENKVLLEIKTLKGVALKKWIGERLAGTGRKYDYNVTDLLVESCGEDLGRLNQEIEKLDIYLPEGTMLKAEHVLKLVSGENTKSIFTFLDLMGEKRKEVWAMAGNLLANEPAPRLFFMIRNRWEELLLVKELSERKQNKARIKAFLSEYYGRNVMEWVVDRLVRQQANHSREQLEGILQELLAIDKSLKTGGNPALLMQNLLARVFGIREHAAAS